MKHLMQLRKIAGVKCAALFAASALIAVTTWPARAQGPLAPPQELDNLVQRIALYPDPLLAQVLTASTYFNQVQDAAGWAMQHQGLHGDQLAGAISEDNLPWEPSVLALLPFPSVLDMMARDMNWTQALGNAVLNQRPEVMDAVQRMREQARNYGYLQNNAQYRVEGGPGAIAILPVNPGYFAVPIYDPYVVYRAPRPGFFVGGAIHFGAGISIGAGFAPYGWRNPAFGWREHSIVIDHRPWERTWGNREHYVHPYDAPRWRPAEGRRFEEHHEFRDHHEDRRERR